MSNATKTLLEAIGSGFTAALLDTFAWGNPHSRLIPLIIFFGVLAAVLLCVALAIAIEADL